MTYFTDPHVRMANLEDIPALVVLLNKSYRGESSRAGWTTEADLIAGDVRTDQNNLQQVMQECGSVILKYVNEGKILACVNLKKHERGTYLGMFSVEPELQGGGLGKKMLKAAEEHARYTGSKAIYMFVISRRAELIDWYTRNGYYNTGERVPFHEDVLTGRHKMPLEFVILEKKLVAE